MPINLGPCEITGVFGPMASGKTYLINQWLKQGQNRYVRFDSTGETCDDPQIEHVWQSPAQLWARLKQNPYFFQLAYHPGGAMSDDFHYALQCLWRIDQYKLLVCDEFHEVCSVNETPAYVKTMLRYARHAHLAMIGASQRLADVHKLFTGGCRQIILFKNDDARDVDAVRDRWGKECALAFQKLRPCIYDDVKKICLQIPQALVIVRGSKPVVFDFKTDAYVATLGAPSSNQETDPEISSEGDSGEPESGHNDGDGGTIDESENASA